MDQINKIIWAIAVSLLIITSIYFSIKLKFPQLRLIKILSCLKEQKDKKNITIKDSLIMSLSSKIGVGSLSGIAFAIFYGGIGAVFWIWIISFLTSINCYIENILSIIYKEKTTNECKGGPFYYIKKGLKNKKLAIIYSIIAILSYSTGFIAIQNNTITTLINDMFTTNQIIISLIITIISSTIFLKGVKTISNFCNKIFPIMMLIYLAVGFFIILTNIQIIPQVFTNIIEEAFNPKSLNGGIIYIILTGIQKGIFASEAGVGTSAMISGTTNNEDYIKQGHTGIISTYFIGIIISTITSLIIITSNYTQTKMTNINGIELTKYAFNYHLGTFGEIILLIILLLFAFSTIITAYYYAENNLKGLTTKKRLLNILKAITIISLFIGGITSSNYIWKLIDIFVGLLTIINTYSIYKLKDIVFQKVLKK